MLIINLSRLGKSGTGMWRYSLNFLDALSSQGLVSGIICAREHVDKLEKYGVKLIAVPNWVANSSHISHIRPVLWFLYSYWLAFLLRTKFGKETIVSTTHHTLPFLSNQVITVHDLRPYHYPDSYLQQFYFRCLLPQALPRCKHLLTVSNTVRQQISNTFDFPQDKISVIYNSVDTNAFKPYSEKKGYLLAVGASWRHKNIDSLLKAHQIWFKQFRLVIVCGHTDYVDEMKQYVVDSQLSNAVSFHHNVPFNELQKLYAEASALVYPSLDEGFGIPPIEALACLTPVIVSDIPVFHEVLGDAAIYVKPDNLESWKQAFLQLNSHQDWYEKAMFCANKYNLNMMKMAIRNWISRMDQ
ncbi:glycosyltransferase family 4 protein [Photorhabdus caribbeanensis]|uniref:glycosyltransferase family 4 protein n=1 Tax=Photorhabdus caribbeanensis TaxID=1004165 RepID=UPI001BD54420|nr:glycosyltransferase family 1 protein [Photorhabdus caribbeanensis]MBS9423353.1 glycosyltransferase family 1 protein [Photorhabdus caribbeanensis]